MADMVRLALHERRRKPIFLIDAAVPGDIEPAVNRLDGAFLYDITDLERVAAEGRASREAVAGAAWRIVEDEATLLFRGLAERTAVPSLIALRRSFENTRGDVLKAAGGDAEEATRLLVNRLLHPPSEEMRTIAAQALNATDGDGDGGEWERLDAALKRLFRLDAGDGTGGEEAE
jgi:glutamyl-tRNA reductase